jgi:hypothetical protein
VPKERSKMVRSSLLEQSELRVFSLVLHRHRSLRFDYGNTISESENTTRSPHESYGGRESSLVEVRRSIALLLIPTAK